ncbi:hypothetical protein FACS1894105_13180 [Clostridia bacterium]|nr:hypothetical protein FACS1894105_13180 [Clostridia bacterium]
MKKRKNKPLEFMQCAVIAALCLPFLWVTYSYILAQQDKINTLENLSMTVITVPVAAIIWYVIQNCARAKWFGDKTKSKSKSKP